MPQFVVAKNRHHYQKITENGHQDYSDQHDTFENGRPDQFLRLQTVDVIV